MTKQEIKKEIERLEEKKFYNNMVDRWTAENYKRDTELTNQIRELKKLLDK